MLILNFHLLSGGGQNSIANLALVLARGAPIALVSLSLVGSALGARLSLP